MNVNFTVFIDKILSGDKRQTIRRASPKWANVKPGDKLTLYTGLRTKQCRKLGEAVVESITPITMRTNANLSGGIWGMVFVNGQSLEAPDLTILARADGFEYVSDFLGWFNQHYGYAFTGNIIKWRDFVPAMESGVCEMNFSKALKTALKNHAPAQAVKPLRWRKSGAREISEEIEGVSFSIEKTHYRTQAVPIFSAVLLLDGEAICVVGEDTDANAVKGAVNRWIKNFVRKACEERNDAK
ncbi:MAG: hypothetical protein IJI37_00625 [Opitutales bacterium]|nr:hypothetical protein [Opitutales bacterium]